MIGWTATREVMVMPKKRYTPEEIVQHPRTVELETSKGLAVLDACRTLGITEQMLRPA
jgi:putative transposase